MLQNAAWHSPGNTLRDFIVTEWEKRVFVENMLSTERWWNWIAIRRDEYINIVNII
jgi:hypothetical protein